MHGTSSSRSLRFFDRTFRIVLAVALIALVARTLVVDAAIVEGKSMLPRYKGGEVILIFKAAYGVRLTGRYLVHWADPLQGDVVAAVRPDRKEIVIKRIGEIRREGETVRFFLIGDNAIESIDSRDFGPVSFDHIIGRVAPQR